MTKFRVMALDVLDYYVLEVSQKSAKVLAWIENVSRS